MDLRQALRLEGEARVAFVGAGGKTTAMFQLARSMEPPVVVTTSTHLGAWQAELADYHMIITRPDDIERNAGQIESVCLITGPLGDDQRLGGLTSASLNALQALSNRLHFSILIEADGARQLPLKAPAAYEPQIPAWVDTVVVVAGLSGLGKTLDERTVHRPEQFSRLAGDRMGETISHEGLARVLNSPQGGLKGIPFGSRKILLLNQAEDEELKNIIMRIAIPSIKHFDSIIISSLSNKITRQVIEPTAGIILAAGGSTRFGEPKMLLQWQGKPIIRHIAEVAFEANLAQLVVVTGQADAEIREALQGLHLDIVHNPDWEEGQSTSVRKGLAALAQNTGSAIFLLADQPYVSREVIRALIERHQLALAKIIVPQVNGHRANPVLFDCSMFPDLVSLEGDTGGRALFKRYPPDFLDWDDARILLDIDTPEDYDRLQQEQG